MTSKSTWVSNPTKRQMILTNIAWLTGVILMILAITNFFSDSAFKSKNLVLFFLMISATITEIKVTYNYFKNESSNK